MLDVYELHELAQARNEIRHLEQIDTDLLDGYAYQLWYDMLNNYRETVKRLEAKN